MMRNSPRRRVNAPALGPLRPIALGVMLACSGGALANPSGPQVAAGAASFQTKGSTLTVTNAPGTIINWQSFSIHSGEHTRFQQASQMSAVLNRVVGADPSSILGSLTSNGRVFLVNPHGIVFGAGARIDTAGFIASTLNIADRDFLEGRFKFEGGGRGMLRNEGAIRASGDIMLVGPTVENAGLLRSDNGRVLLAAGKSVTITSPDAQGVKFDVQAPQDSAVNLGSIEAHSAAAMFAGTLTHSGDIRATTASLEGGRIVLSAQKQALVQSGSTISASGAQGGSVRVESGETTSIAGTIEAKGDTLGGGRIEVLGDRVTVQSGALADASGAAGGGTVLVGGDYQGRNAALRNASSTHVAPGSVLRADASSSGDGGTVIVWADGSTRFHGNISARGGAYGGDGGLVETSGKESLVVSGAFVDTRAPNGHIGRWLLDPKNINVVAGGGSGGSTFNDNVGSTDAIDRDVIGTAATHVELQANNDITFVDAVTMANAGVSLSAQAGRSILVQADITTNGGDVVLIANEAAPPVVAADRDPGPAHIMMNAGTHIDAGGGNVTLRVTGFTHPGEPTKTAGNIVVSQITGGNVSVVHEGVHNGVISRSDPASLITASNGLHMRSQGSSAAIGTPTEPMNIATPRIEAQTLNGDGGIFLNAQGDLEIGGVAFYAGAERGVQTISDPLRPPGDPGTHGDIEITVSGNLTRFEGTLSACGAGGGSGGPICANNGDVTLEAAQIGAPGASGRMHVDTGIGTAFNQDPHGTVSARSTVGGIFIQRRHLPLDTSTHLLDVAPGAPIELAANSRIAVDASINAPGSSILLEAGPDQPVRFHGVTVTGQSLEVVTSGSGAIEIGDGTSTINAEFSNSASVLVQGTLVLNGGGVDTGTYTLDTGTSLQLNGGMRAFDGARVDGSGSLAIGPAGSLLVTGGVPSTISATTAIDNAGTLGLGFGSTLVTNGAGITSAGRIEGAGTLDLGGGTLTNNGIVDPGLSGGLPGTITINGNYTQGPGGTLVIDVTEAAPGLFDALAVTGHAALDGTLSVNHVNMYMPASDTSVNALTYGSVSGDFATLIVPAEYAPFYSTNAGANAYTVALGDIVNAWLAGSGDWGVPANWSLGHVPNEGEDALIDVGGPGTTETVSMTSGTHFARRLISNENFSMTAGEFTLGPLESTVNAAFEIAGGILTLEGPLAANSLTLSGGMLEVRNSTGTLPRLTMSGGMLLAPGTITIAGPFNASGGFVAPGDGPAESLVLQGPTTITTADPADPFTSSRNVSNSGTIALNGELRLSGADFTNAAGGTLNVNTGGLIDLMAVQFVNDGTVNVSTADMFPFGIIPAANPIVNNGTFNKFGADFVNLTHTFANTPSGTINVNGGTLSVAFGGTQSGTINVAQGQLNTDGSLVNVAGGTIGGSGAIDLFGGILTNEAGATVRPGGTTAGGTLSIVGHFTNEGTLAVRLGGQAPGQFGALDVTGVANLGGTLALSTLGGYTAPDGDTFRIVTAPAIVDTFDVTTKTFGNDVYTLERPTFYLIGTGGPDVNAWISDTSGNWNDATRWSRAHAPLATERAFIRRPTDPDVTVPALGSPHRAASLQSTEDLVLEGTLELAGASTIAATLQINAGGLLAGTGALTVTDLSLAGTIGGTGGVTVTDTATVMGGSQIGSRLTAADDFLMTTGGTLNVLAGAELELAGNGQKRLAGGASVINAGTMALAGGSNLVLNEGAQITVGADGRFELRSDADVASTGGAAATFTNNGTVAKTLGGGTSTLGNANINFVNNGGALEAASGTLEYAGVNTFGNGTAFTGADTHAVTSDSTFNGTIASNTLTLRSGSFTGTASFTGTTAWTGGTMSGNFTVPAGAALNASGDGSKTLSGAAATLTNNGGLNIAGDGAFVVAGGATLTNNAAATWSGGAGGIVVNAGSTIVNNSVLGLTATANDTGVSGAGTLQNNGILNSNAPGVTTVIASVFNNPGTANIDAGALRLTGNGTDTGTYAVDAGTTLEVGGGTRGFEGGLAITGPGTLLLSGGTLDVRTGTLPALDISGGTLTRSTAGDLTIAGAFNASGGAIGAAPAGGGILLTNGTTTLTGTLALGRNWTNAGVVNESGGQIAPVAGSAVQFTNAGTFNLETPNPAPFAAADATIVNNGTFNKNAAGVSDLGNAYTNAAGGVLNVNDGTLRLPGVNTQNGTINIAAGATLDTAGQSLTNAPGATLAGAGIVDLSDALLDNRGTLSAGDPAAANPGTLAILGSLALTSGTIDGPGAVTVSGTTGIASGASILNTTLSTNGLAMTGGSLEVAAPGVLNLDGPGANSIAGATLTSSGIVNVGGSGDVTISDGGLWDNFGALNLAGSARIVLGGAGGATLVNRGSGTITDTTTNATPITTAGAPAAGKSFMNAGTLTKAAGSAGTQTIDVPMTNTGTLNVTTGVLVASAFPTNSGIIDVEAGATFSTGGAPLTNSAFGLIKGDGTVIAPIVTNNGTVAPGASPGTLTIAGDYVQGPGGTLLVELGGSVPGTDYDVLAVTGNAALGGTLVVTNSAGKPIEPDSAFQFLTYASSTGDFAAFSVPSGFAFQASPGPTAYTISNTVAPTPQEIVQAAAVTQNEAVVLNERVIVTQTPDNTDADAERRALRECR